MQTSGYVGNIERVENGRGDHLVELRGTINRCGTVKPRTAYVAKNREVETRYLPARDFGLLILTTNSGVMHHYDAKDARIGGNCGLRIKVNNMVKLDRIEHIVTIPEGVTATISEDGVVTIAGPKGSLTRTPSGDRHASRRQRDHPSC